jgi:Protein of unknown function (DUF2752)
VKEPVPLAAGPVLQQRTGPMVRIRRGGLPLGAILGLLALMGGVAVRFLHLDRLGITLCTFKAMTGLPCMTCGGTRTLGLLARGDLGAALAMNPLVALAFFVLVPWALVDLVLWTRGRAVAIELGPAGPRAVIAVIVVVLANWAYLILMGR